MGNLKRIFYFVLAIGLIVAFQNCGKSLDLSGLNQESTDLNLPISVGDIDLYESEGLIVRVNKSDSDDARVINVEWSFDEDAEGSFTQTSGNFTIASLAQGSSFTLQPINNAVLEANRSYPLTFRTTINGESEQGTVAVNVLDDDVPGAAPGAQQIAAGRHHTCSNFGQEIKCWGRNSTGELGTSGFDNPRDASTVVNIDGPATDLSAGWDNTCAVNSGSLYCWGRASEGQLASVGATSAVPLVISGMVTGVTRVAAGMYNVCAIREGSLYCWGYNNRGQAGLSSTNNITVPTVVPGFEDGTIDVSTGGFFDGNYYGHTCAVNSVGAVWCWGHNGRGQLGLGQGNTTGQLAPVEVLSLNSGVTRVAVGGEHSCAIRYGDMWCWGRNTWGQLGNDTTTDSGDPVRVLNLPDDLAVVEIDVGDYHSCARLEDGSVKCWGFNNQGQLGISLNNFTSVGIPQQVMGLFNGVLSIASGERHSCALLSNGIQCWGENESRKLGNTLTANSSIPVDVVIPQ